MKNIIKIGLLLFCTSALNIDLLAQCANTINTQSTDWRNYPTTSSNDWDWTQTGSTYPVYLDNNLSNPSMYIELPYFCTKPPGTGSCDGFHNVESYQFKGNSKQFQDINPEDGWELLLKDFGSPNPLGQYTGGTGRNNPFFILYNKYNGKMKVYVAMMGIHSKQSTFVRLGFDNADPGTTKTSTNQATRALLSPAESIQKTVLEFKPVLEYKQMNQVLAFQSANDHQWMVCELTTSYDPCTCENAPTHPNDISTLTMQLVSVGTVSIEATIDGKATPENVASGTTASSTTDGSLASFFDVITDGGDAAQKGKKDWENTGKTMKDIVDFGNEVLVKQLAKEWLKKDNPNWDNNNLKSLNKAALKLLLATPDSVKKMFGVRQPKNTQLGKVLEATKGIASTLPYVGMAIGIIDYLVDGGEETKSSEKSGPVTYDINLRLNGTLTESQYVSKATFFTPGSPIPSSAGGHLTPIYNNVLGVFNVLELPDLEYAELNPNISIGNRIFSGNSCRDSYDELNNLEGAGDVKLRQYRPKTNIKYVVNPASEMEVHSIDAAIILEYKNDQSLFVTRTDQISGNVAMPYHNMMAFSNSKLDNWCNLFSPPIPNCDTSVSGLERRVDDIINTTGLKLDFVSAKYPTDQNTFIRFRTGYVPITCFTSSDFMLLGSNNFGKVYVKLYVKLKHKTNINAEPVTMIITYDWTEKVKLATKLTSPTGTYNTSIFAGSIGWDEKWFKCGVGSFSAGVYSNYRYGSNWFLGNVPFGNKGIYLPDNYSYSNEQFLNVEDRLTIPSGANIPNNSVIKAGGVITIKPNVNFGNNILIVSGVKIDLQASNAINPNVELRIDPLNEILFNCTDFDYASLHNSQTEINQFCGKTAYTELVYASAPKINDPNEEKNNSVTQTDFNFLLVPNPSNGIASLEFSKELNNFNIEICDVTGKVVYRSEKLESATQFDIDISSFKDGIYFVRITSIYGILGNAKLIKQ